MHLSIAFLVAILASASAAPAAVCSNNTFSPFLRFADFEPARSFCVARFPVAPVHRTSMVIKNAVLTETTTRTVANIRNGRLAATVTKTSTITSTSTSTKINLVTVSRVQTSFRTVTITSTSKLPVNQKRQHSRAHKFDGQRFAATTTAVEKREEPSHVHKFEQGKFAATRTLNKRAQPPCTSEAAMSSQWQMLVAKRRDIVSTGCGCIQTPRIQMALRTSTSHRTVTKTVTVTSAALGAALAPKTVFTITTLRAVVTVTRLSSVTRVQTVVATRTSTILATTSVCSNRNAVPAPAFYECTYNIRCYTKGSYAASDVTGLPITKAKTLQDCLVACNNEALCGALNFNRDTGTCVLVAFSASLLADEVNDFTTSTNSAFDFAYVSDLTC